MAEVMRDVLIEPYIKGHPFFRLQLIDNGQTDRYGKSGIGYRLAEYNSDGSFRDVIFTHEEHGIIRKPGVIDDDEAVGAVLQWLTLRPGDTDDDFFDDYTERQLEFAEQNGETLSLFADEWSGELEPEDGEEFSEPTEWPGDDLYEEL